MRRHRTTARGALLLLLLTALGAASASASTRHVDPPATKQAATKGAAAAIVFPIVGAAEYGDNYGDARANGAHAGIDIMTTWRSAAVAAEAGKIKLWTTSARAGCMLYLYGASGTTYLYIHLNNDLTAKRDNRGSCVPGVAYADGLRDGARVKAGQVIGYNGDSGDAEGTYHLHFEVHPKDGADVNPFPYLNAATRLLFPAPTGTARKLVLGLRGTPISAGGGVLEVSVTAVRVWPGVRWTAIEPRSLELAVPELADIDERVAAQIQSPTRRALASRKGLALTVFTAPVAATDEVLRGDAGALVVDRVQVAGSGGTAAGAADTHPAPTGGP
jgi:hypothetical protein